MIGKLRKTRYLAERVLRQVVQQPGDRERLAVAQLDVGLGAARRQRRNSEARQVMPFAKVERADLGPHLEPNRIAGDRRA